MNLAYRVPEMWPIIELFFGEKLFWFLTQVARSCVVLFILRNDLLMLTQAGLKLCSPASAFLLLGFVLPGAVRSTAWF